ncbi:uncharacterized protein [Clytia hemisphaerica]|uniref:uncharacterized protein n=1 Tax=Clytia hemisphaerica TaxID=252671 RepID=UPI0034D50FDA
MFDLHAWLADHEYPHVGEKVIISGWGLRRPKPFPPYYRKRVPDVLRVTEVFVDSDSVCRAAHSSWFPIIYQHYTQWNYNERIHDESMLCASGTFNHIDPDYGPQNKDSCHGDSGGPLMYNLHSNQQYYLAGIVSWGTSGCMDPKQEPTIYTDVAALRGWIDRTLAGYGVYPAFSTASTRRTTARNNCERPSIWRPATTRQPVTQPPRTQRPVIPGTNTADLCRNKNDGTRLSNPNSCSSYIVCTHRRATIMNCPPRTLYDRNSRRCDHERLVRCSAPARGRQPVTQPRTNTADLCRNRKDETRLSNPNSCSSYFFCKHGQTTIMNCPPVTLYDETYGCIHETRVDCSASARSRQPVTQPRKNTADICRGINDGAKQINPNTCSSYIVCEHSRPTIIYCRSGTLYDRDSRRCIHETRVRCSLSGDVPQDDGNNNQQNDLERLFYSSSLFRRSFADFLAARRQRFSDEENGFRFRNN